jgi:hypothetical protein
MSEDDYCNCNLKTTEMTRDIGICRAVDCQNVTHSGMCVYCYICARQMGVCCYCCRSKCYPAQLPGSSSDDYCYSPSIYRNQRMLENNRQYYFLPSIYRNRCMLKICHILGTMMQYAINIVKIPIRNIGIMTCNGTGANI